MACTTTTPLVSVCVCEAWWWWSVASYAQLADLMCASSQVMLAAVFGSEQAMV